MKILNKILFICIFSYSFLITITTAWAVETNSLVFNEIMYNLPGSDTKGEWVEIKNTSLSDVEINSNWRLNDGANHLLKLHQGTNTIVQNSFFVIVQDAQTFLLNYPNYLGTIYQSAFSLNNESDNIKLSADKGQNWICEISYSNNLGANGDGNSLEWDNELNLLRRSFILGGSPGKQNSTVLDLPQYSRDIIINEILANPSNGTENEFIELFNQGNSDIDISGWKLDDAKDGGSSPYILSDNTIIKSKNYLVYYHKTTGISLNNDGDVVRLLYPDEREASIIYYPKAESDLSYFRNSDSIWQWSAISTVGAENKLQLLETKNLPSEFATPKKDISIIELPIIELSNQVETVANNTNTVTNSIANKIELPKEEVASSKSINQVNSPESMISFDQAVNNLKTEPAVQNNQLTKLIISLIIITNVLSIIYIFWLWKKPTFLNQKTNVNNLPNNLPKI